MLTPEQIWNMVMERYPELQREITCWQLKQSRDNKREAYRQRLIKELNDTETA
jgi:hypothetical protein